MIKLFNNFIDTDIGYSFKNSKIAIISTIVFLIIVLSSMFAGIVAPYDPFDPASISLMDAFTPPVWVDGGTVSFLLGTDQQGRDMFSTMIYGSRISLTVGFASIIDRSNKRNLKIKKKIISHLKIDVPVFNKNKIPDSLKLIPIKTPGSRFAKWNV